MKPAKIEFENHAMFALHNMPCAIYYEDKLAVVDCQSGNFAPSWKAQREGWKLVQAKTKFQKFLLRIFFKQRFDTPLFERE